MHILCTICSDLVNQAENIYVTKCGHVFHFTCLSQWIARSKSCPQCRNKVTDRCMFRLYPTISNENTGEDVTTLQSRLDDLQFQLRQDKTKAKENEDKLATITADLRKHEELLKNCEKKLVSRESAVSALKEQLEYVKAQNRETQRLREENENLRKNIQTLNGLQKVLNATGDEVEQMLEGYTDVRTIATFATALKRALCESESKKNESRDRMQTLKQQLHTERSNVSDLQTKLLHAEERLSAAERKYEGLKLKRKASTSVDLERSSTENSLSTPKHMRSSDQSSLNDAIVINDSYDSNCSFGTMVRRIESADSPYLSLKQSSLALAALQRQASHPLPTITMKPSEFAIVNAVTSKSSENIPLNSQTSIFHKKQLAKVDFSGEQTPSSSDFELTYDGLGGHSKLDSFPKPLTTPPSKSCIPRVSAKHKLRRPAPPSTHSILKMWETVQKY